MIPCFRQAQFVDRAIESVLAQSYPADEIIVVDDGGDQDLLAIVSKHSNVRLIRQANSGLAAARNAGLRAAKSERIVFLDADDRLLPDALRAGLDCFADHDHCVFVYGAHDEVRGDSRRRCFKHVESRIDLVRFNQVGMIAAVMFDRGALLAHDGFDETLGMCEDWDVYLRLAREGAFAAHDRPVAEYVKHAGNMSNDVRALKKWIGVVRQRERARGLSAEEERAWREGALLWDAAYPERTPAHLVRRLARRFARAIRQLRAA